jgi:5-methylcytosine-specific restriction endonuclease McrA
MQNVLVLNASYEPLQITSLRRAILLVLKQKAELIEADETHLRSEHAMLSVPLVIRLRKYVSLPNTLARGPTRRWVMARDRHQCQYCGQFPPRSDLTLDHVLPRSLGGGHTWENLVASCRRCNNHKGGRTPQDANMQLLRRPTRPRYAAMVMFAVDNAPEVWRKYLDGEMGVAA